MPGTILIYRNDGDRPFCRIALETREQVQLTANSGGLVIKRVESQGSPEEILFEGDAKLVSKLCAGLFDSPDVIKKTPLEILVPFVIQLRSAADVKSAFRDAAKSLG